jgi:homocysteine S-methyltransferase
VTTPVFDVAALERFLRRIEWSRLPIVVSLWPFESVLNAEFMANEVPGVRVPSSIVERMRRSQDAAAEGIAIAREIAGAVRAMVQGVHIAVPSGRIETVIEVLAGIRNGTGNLEARA